MATELLDIVDTAVKIGLGALISGVATYKVSQLAHYRERQREVEKRFLEKLENAADLAENYFNKLLFLFARIDAVVRHSQGIPDNVSEEEWNSIEKEDKALTSTWTDRDRSVIRLRLLGADKSVKELKNISDLEKESREKFFFNKCGACLPSLSDLNDFVERAKKTKIAFCEELSISYRGICKL